RRTLRRRVRERVALPRPIARSSPRPARAVAGAEAPRHPLRVEPARLERRGLARPRGLARLLHGRRLRGAAPLLSPGGTTAERAAVAGVGLAQERLTSG